MTRKEKRLKRIEKAEKKKLKKIWYKGDIFCLKKYMGRSWLNPNFKFNIVKTDRFFRVDITPRAVKKAYPIKFEQNKFEYVYIDEAVSEEKTKEGLVRLYDAMKNEEDKK